MSRYTPTCRVVPRHVALYTNISWSKQHVGYTCAYEDSFEQSWTRYMYVYMYITIVNSRLHVLGGITYQGGGFKNYVFFKCRKAKHKCCTYRSVIRSVITSSSCSPSPSRQLIEQILKTFPISLKHKNQQANSRSLRYQNFHSNIV